MVAIGDFWPEIHVKDSKMMLKSIKRSIPIDKSGFCMNSAIPVINYIPTLIRKWSLYGSLNVYNRSAYQYGSIIDHVCPESSS